MGCQRIEAEFARSYRKKELSSLSRSRSLLVFASSLFLAVLFGQLLILFLDPSVASGPAFRLSAANGILPDFLWIAAFIVAMVNGSGRVRLLAYFSFTVLVSIYGTQLIALKLTGNYLSPVALANIQHIGLIASAWQLWLLFGLFLLLALGFWLVERFLRPSAWPKVLGLAVILFTAGLVLHFDSYWLPENLREAREKLYRSDGMPIGSVSPLRALYRSLARLRHAEGELQSLSARDLRIAARFGIHYDPGAEYPLIRENIYTGALPFEPRTPPRRNMNVIVFFSEGISARTIQPYSDAFPGLTPNIARMAEVSMRVDNYYNHGFATYRGLLGQLCSIYPLYAGGRIHNSTEYYCVANLLHRNGYRTRFLFSQRKSETRLDELFAKANFETVYGSEELREKYLNNEARKRPLALSDQQFFRALVAHLKTMENESVEAPFFLGLYNIETHAFTRISDDGQPYPRADSYVLDSIHNFDAAFGRFWDYFRGSPFYENTVVIFTSDHAHFQSQAFVSLVESQTDYKPYFVDRIPLLVYHPGLKLPATYDARYSSSIDFAPSLAHLLGLGRQRNAFVGRSVFETRPDKGYAWGEGYLFSFDSSGIGLVADDAISEEDTDRWAMSRIIGNIHALETLGRVWERGSAD